MGISAGRLNRRIGIWRDVEQDNGKGGYTSSFQQVATTWAEVIGLNGREAMIAQAFQGVSSYRITIRFRTDLLDTDQIKYGAVNLNVRSISDPDGLREQLQILADTASVRSTA